MATKNYIMRRRHLFPKKFVRQMLPRKRAKSRRRKGVRKVGDKE